MLTHYRFALSFQHSNAFVLKETNPCNVFNSNSAILSIAAFLVEYFPQIVCSPRNSVAQFALDPQSELSKHEQIETHPNYGHWSIYLNNCVYSKHAANVNNTLYVQIPLSEVNLEKFMQGKCDLFQEKKIPESTHSNHQRLKLLFDLPNIRKSKAKVGVFANSPTDIFKFKYIDSAHLLGTLYNNEDWNYFEITNEQLDHIPSVDELMTFDCIILPGSPLTATDNHPKIAQAITRLFSAYRQSAKLKIIGICFGHQLISHHFKAKVQKRHKCHYIQKVDLMPEVIKKFSFLKPLEKGGLGHVHISQNHEDHVIQVPTGFHLLGRSQSCDIESLVSDNGRIFTMQFHPQSFNNNYLRRLTKLQLQNSIKQAPIQSPSLQNALQIEKLRSMHYRDAQLMRKCMALFIQE